ncbi:cytochrome P450 [Qipengyuania sp. JC766]|uniref:cytochrome P450 n=1 Tax=Qipengyuania sp. JC766 TaxID=3232139 RepID=UPI0034578D67
MLWPVLRFFQLVRPVANIAGVTVITREEDVRSVLASPDRFRVPFGPEMKALAGGETFLLGLDGEDHAEQKRVLLDLIALPRDADFIGEISDRYAEALLDAAKGEIDVQQDLVMRVAAEACIRYMGFEVTDSDAFAKWTIAVSNVLFGDPSGSPVAAELAAAAGEQLRAVADRALHSAATGQTPPDTLAGRFVAMSREPGGPTLPQARAILIGLAAGFVPTNSLAGGKMLQLLSKNGQARREAIAAARSNDRNALRRVLMEAGRLNPALAPGQWRWCPQRTTVERPDGSSFAVPAKRLVLVSTMAALRDPRSWKNPNRFDAEREREPDLLFGHMFHTCLGKELALAQLTSTFGALLRRPDVEKSMSRLRMKFRGPYPCHARLTYGHPARDPRGGGRNQNGIVFAVPFSTEHSDDLANGTITKAFDTAASRAALDGTGTVHFLSCTAIELPRDESSRRMLLIEVNADGCADSAAVNAIRAIEEPLRSVLETLGCSPGRDLHEFVMRHRVKMHGRPWGATALNFYGLPDLTVTQIAKEQELAEFVRAQIDEYQRSELGRSSRPSSVLAQVRRAIRGTGNSPIGTGEGDWSAKGYEDLLLKPKGSAPHLSKWSKQTQPKLWDIIRRSALFARFAWAFVIVSLFAGTLLYIVLDPGSDSRTALWLSLPWLALQSFAASLAAFAILAGFGVWLLRWKEKRDRPDREKPDLTHLRKLALREDLPGHAKNHITVVTPLKTGLLRRLTLAFALWGVGQVVTHYFRPGFVLNMGTIQFARWVRLPGTDTMVFQSNYDGNWESYLEDFITRAHLGQTAVWSNCEGFPKSRFLLLDGAENGDQFKNYVRRKQVPTAYWYARFPAITADQIRRNHLIREGLARATTDSEARDWLALFGSAPRLESEIESEEVQALVFQGFGHLKSATFLMLQLPADRNQARNWLRALTGYRVEGSILDGKSVLEGILNERGELDPKYRVTFGEMEPDENACAFGISSAGLRKLLREGHPLLDELPGAYAMGMRERAALIGDRLEDPLRWDDGDTPCGIDVVLAIYSANASSQEAALAAHANLIDAHGIVEIDRQQTCDLPESGSPEDHFGFRDGLVQPVIAGTSKSRLDRNPDDIVAAGEMIGGYANVQGYVSPGVHVAATHDPMNVLPDAATRGSPYPRFGRDDDTPCTPRDFSRNGTFMAIRVLEQHVGSFESACEHIARNTNAKYQHLASILGRNVTPDWVAAKLVGRWKNGSSLLSNPADPGEFGPDDYALPFGRDDPRGLRCPFGSHVRRANPRDSLLPGDKQETAIANRHRLMRRGRNYVRGEEKGLFFVALCADLERQFEFVQRNWLNSSSFHTLSGENDPLLGRKSEGCGKFTVPTSGGSIVLEGLSSFVSTRAGGYFFVPSRSALLFLAT